MMAMELIAPGQVELSSATLNALKRLDVEAKAVVSRLVEKVQAAGVYATSRALADTDLLFRLSVVAISEVSAQLAKRMLPGASSGDDSSSSSPPVNLSFEEKLKLVTLGISPVQS